MNKLILWNLPEDVTEEDLFEEFERYCVTRVDFYVSKYAVLTFGDQQNAEDVLKEWNGRVWRGRRIKVKIANY